MSTDVRGLVFAATYRALTSETPERSARFAEVITAEVVQGLEEVGTVIVTDLPEVTEGTWSGQVVIDGWHTDAADYSDALRTAKRYLALYLYLESLPTEPDPADVEALERLILASWSDAAEYATLAVDLLRSGKVTVTR